eukprot:1903815-Rhodomonas_salina.3
MLHAPPAGSAHERSARAVDRHGAAGPEPALLEQPRAAPDLDGAQERLDPELWLGHVDLERALGTGEGAEGPRLEQPAPADGAGRRGGQVQAERVQAGGLGLGPEHVEHRLGGVDRGHCQCPEQQLLASGRASVRPRHVASGGAGSRGGAACSASGRTVSIIVLS